MARAPIRFSQTVANPAQNLRASESAFLGEGAELRGAAEGIRSFIRPLSKIKAKQESKEKEDEQRRLVMARIAAEYAAKQAEQEAKLEAQADGSNYEEVLREKTDRKLLEVGHEFRVLDADEFSGDSGIAAQTRREASGKAKLESNLRKYSAMAEQTTQLIDRGLNFVAHHPETYQSATESMQQLVDNTITPGTELHQVTSRNMQRDLFYSYADGMLSRGYESQLELRDRLRSQVDALDAEQQAKLIDRTDGEIAHSIKVGRKEAGDTVRAYVDQLREGVDARRPDLSAYSPFFSDGEMDQISSEMFVAEVSLDVRESIKGLPMAQLRRAESVMEITKDAVSELTSNGIPAEMARRAVQDAVKEDMDSRVKDPAAYMNAAIEPLRHESENAVLNLSTYLDPSIPTEDKPAMLIEGGESLDRVYQANADAAGIGVLPSADGRVRVLPKQDAIALAGLLEGVSSGEDDVGLSLINEIRSGMKPATFSALMLDLEEQDPSLAKLRFMAPYAGTPVGNKLAKSARLYRENREQASDFTKDIDSLSREAASEFINRSSDVSIGKSPSQFAGMRDLIQMRATHLVAREDMSPGDAVDQAMDEVYAQQFESIGDYLMYPRELGRIDDVERFSGFLSSNVTFGKNRSVGLGEKSISEVLLGNSALAGINYPEVYDADGELDARAIERLSEDQGLHLKLGESGEAILIDGNGNPMLGVKGQILEIPWEKVQSLGADVTIGSEEIGDELINYWASQGLLGEGASRMAETVRRERAMRSREPRESGVGPTGMEDMMSTDGVQPAESAMKWFEPGQRKKSGRKR